MCGIVGILGPRRDLLRKSLDLIKHRGPDRLGYFEDDVVSLGHARLSIIDLSSTGNQPMIDLNSGSALVFNGEIYNYVELRHSLESEGITFAGTSDTEVLLRGMVRYGWQFLERANGIFALGFWDPTQRRLTLARDPVGVKPLFYHSDGSQLGFSSEPKGLLPLLGDVRLDKRAFSGYLRFHYTPGLQTLIRGIEELPAGAAWTFDVATSTWAEQATIKYSPRVPQKIVDGRSLWRAISEAVQRQMVADVPVGCFLSGGIDSSTIAYCASQATNEPLKTYSVGFDTGFDESELARDFANRIGADHHALEVRGKDVGRDLGEMSWHHDGPVGEAGCIPNWYVSRLAAREVKVVLAGEGSDEQLGGYPWYRMSRRFERVARIIPKGKRLAAVTARLGGRSGKALRALTGNEFVDRYAPLVEVFAPKDIHSAKLPQGPPLVSAGTDAMRIDQQSLLLHCYLRKADSMTMAHGLEERVPFLDLDLRSALSQVPLAACLGPPEKKILREAASPWLPAEIVGRKKRGYGTPILEWMDGTLHESLAQTLAKPFAVQNGILPNETWRNLQASAAPGSARSWVLFAFDSWAQEMDRRGYGLAVNLV